MDHFYMFYYSAQFSRQIYLQWQASPTVTTISTADYPIKNIEFPAITICSQGAAKGIMETVMFKQLERYINSQGETKTKRQKRSPQDIIESLSNEEVGSHGISFEEISKNFFYL